MKARAAAARARKKMAGTKSTRAAVKRLVEGRETSGNARKSVRQATKPAVLGKVMSKKQSRRVHSHLRGTQSQTHRASP